MGGTEGFVMELQSSLEFFERSSRCLTEDDSQWRPTDDLMTVAQQIAHVGLTVDWFLEGAFGDGFDMDFEDHMRVLEEYDSVAKARALVEEAYARAIERIGAISYEEFAQPLPPGPVMGGAPRFGIVSGIVDHTAHHRGVLSVYSRLRGHTPAMPYMDM